MDSLLQHFRKEEQPFIEQAVGWVKEVEDLYAPKLTGFLDPRERFIVQAIAGNSSLLMSGYGAFQEAERQRVLIYPEYYVPETDDYQVSVIQLKYAKKFLTIEHPQVLGSLMSLGVDRSKFGDIQIVDGDVQVAIALELSDYVTANFTQVGKAKVAVEPVDSEAYLQSDEEWTEETQIVSSLRLDVIVASLTNSSRQKAQALIKGERVKVNWTVIDQQAFELQEHDILSIRGFGRFNILAIEGRTRKDKIRLLIGALV